jgi:N-acetylglucosamine kinase-like BadF-type ATPase
MQRNPLSERAFREETMVLLGVDVGGTSIRAVACTPEGGVLGRGSSRGGNFRSSPGDVAQRLSAAIRAALGSAAALDGLTVCVGAAGAGRARRDEVEALVRRAVAAAVQAEVGTPGSGAPDAPADLSGPDAGLSGADAGPLDGRDGRALLLEDLDIAFRSAAPGPDGTLLLAGTGAVAAAFAQWRQIRRRDGLGWLLGDTGSGVWLGRRVLRAVAAQLDHNGPVTAMTPHVLAMLSLTSAERAATAAYPRSAAPEQAAREQIASGQIAPNQSASEARTDQLATDSSGANQTASHGSATDVAASEQLAVDQMATESMTTEAHVPDDPAVADPRGLGLDVDPQDLIRAVDRLAPAEWARFAGTALNAAKTDPVAAALVDQAADGLLATLASARADAGGPTVLAGGLFAAGPLRARIEAAHPGCAYAPFPVVGACAAAAELAGLELDREALTDALL